MEAVGTTPSPPGVFATLPGPTANDLNAALNQPGKEVGDATKVATVVDLFGYVVGLIQNPHFKPKD